MKSSTLKERYNAIKKIAGTSGVGISNYGMLHEVAAACNIKDNSGGNLRYIANRVAQIMKELIKAGYPIVEYKIKCCSWTSKETWHPIFYFKED